MEIRGVRGYFNDSRIDRATVPDGFCFGNWQMVTVIASHAVTNQRYW